MGHLRIVGLAMLGGKESKGLLELLKMPAPTPYTTPPAQGRPWRDDVPATPPRVRFSEQEYSYQPAPYGGPSRANWRQPAPQAPPLDPRLAPQQLFNVPAAELEQQRFAPAWAQPGFAPPAVMPPPALPAPGLPPGNGPTPPLRQGDAARVPSSRAAGNMIAPSRSVIGDNVPGAKNHDDLVCFSCGAGTGPPDASGRKNGHVGASCPKEVIRKLGETWPGWAPNGETKLLAKWSPCLRYITKDCAQDWLNFLAVKNITANFDSSGRSPLPDFGAIARGI
jgi:hypothetical protein